MVMRNAMTMIELVFAIVIIAIVVAGVPQMIARNDKSLEANLVQEEIFRAATMASQALSQQWDTNSEDSSALLAYAKVLDTGVGAARQSVGLIELERKIGHIAQDNHRRFHGVTTAPASSTIPGVGDSGYWDGGFSTGHSTTAANMKMANITVGIVTLRVYMANIGEVTYAKRTF